VATSSVAGIGFVVRFRKFIGAWILSLFSRKREEPAPEKE